MKVAARTRSNRRNAQASTGPRSSAGKERVARNALRHGLNVPLRLLPGMEEAVARLADLIAGAAPDDARLEAARRIAEAQLDLVRIRQQRVALLSDPEARRRSLSWREVKKEMAATEKCKDLHEILMRFERRANRFLREGSKSLVEGLDVLDPKLETLDRYERRALSRRKRAIRDLSG